jgi:hypothetical protein
MLKGLSLFQEGAVLENNIVSSKLSLRALLKAKCPIQSGKLSIIRFSEEIWFNENFKEWIKRYKDISYIHNCFKWIIWWKLFTEKKHNNK